MFTIINEKDGRCLKTDGKQRGFYMDFNEKMVHDVEFKTKKEARKEAKNWIIGGMFPVAPKVKEIN